MNKTVLFAGAPGTGKGTIAQRILSSYDLCYIATGDLFRDHIARKSEIGKIALGYIKEGKLVPNEVTDEIIAQRLFEDDAKKNAIILDGYPRNIGQAKAIEKALAKINKQLDIVIWFKHDSTKIIDRIIYRRTCKNCSRVYHLKTMPPIKKNKCNNCKGMLYQRKDDTKDSVIKRIKEFENQTMPLYDYYKSKKILFEVDTFNNNWIEEYITIIRETKMSKNLKYMKKAGYIAALIHKEYQKVVKPGISLLKLDEIAKKIILENKALPNFSDYKDYDFAICASVNDVVVHGVPSDYILKEGDIVTLDVGAKFKGWNSDTAVTYAVGKILPEAKKIMDVTKQALDNALKVVKDGVRVGDISHAIQSYVEGNGMSIPVEFSGHGIGKSLHELPHILNIGKKDSGPILKSGDVICIEPIVHAGKPGIKIAKDGYTAHTKDGSLGAHYEHTVQITDKGYIILTSLEQKEVING